ncbi:MAG: CBS domain-containing protein [Bryobacteraceae bacterium]|nr:CBS domain-containing protein [Bryobacteraceae bacterium]
MNHSDAVRCVLREKGRQVFSVTPETSVYDALALMAQREIGALLVTTGEGRLCGLISERDYARKVILQGRSSMDTSVEDIMSEGVVTVTPSHTIDECMKIMTELRIRHLPVMEGISVAGLVSMGDLVKYVISAQLNEIEALHAYIAGTY